jgi:hypothetical protein
MPAAGSRTGHQLAGVRAPREHHAAPPQPSEIPDTLEDVCDPDRLALLVYDMQVGIIGPLADGPQVIDQVGRVLEAGRRAGVRVFFTRYMSLPMGISQLRMAMAWQHEDRVEDNVSPVPAGLARLCDCARARPDRIGSRLRQAFDVGLRGHASRVRAA